jgi:hypothetical protein
MGRGHVLTDPRAVMPQSGSPQLGALVSMRGVLTLHSLHLTVPPPRATVSSAGRTDWWTIATIHMQQHPCGGAGPEASHAVRPFTMTRRLAIGRAWSHSCVSGSCPARGRRPCCPSEVYTRSLPGDYPSAAEMSPTCTRARRTARHDRAAHNGFTSRSWLLGGNRYLRI